MKTKKNIAIQGKKGSFHHIVAERYFGENLSLILCDTFDKTVTKLIKGEADYVVMAIENSIAGSIIPNYALIDQNNVKIIGEYGLSISHNFMGLKGQQINDIKEVYSHPMAFLQCKSFFNNYPHIRLVESEDTAEEAQRIFKNNMKGIGAIASKEAAEMYNLSIFASSIQTIKNNVTRFVILNNDGNLISKENINLSLIHI